MARTDTLGHFLTDVADAIREKKGTSGTITASDFDTEIANLPSGGNVKIRPKSISFNYSTLTAIDLSLLDDTDLTTMNMRFYHCDNLKTLNGADNLFCPNVNDFQYMFAFCGLLEGELNLSNLNPVNITSTISCMNMFYQCTNLTRIDLKNFAITPSQTNGMFFNCISLEFIDIRKMELTGLSTSNSQEMFGGRTYKIPADCEIIVKDSANKTWVTTNYDWLTNVKTVAEYEAE